MRDPFRVCQSVCLRLVDVGLIQDAMAAVCYNYLGARSHTQTHPLRTRARVS